jgi:hypothetical protein
MSPVGRVARACRAYRYQHILGNILVTKVAMLISGFDTSREENARLLNHRYSL